MDDLQTAYKKALNFAAEKHAGQLLPGTSLPYLVHLTNVSMELLVAGTATGNLRLPFAVSVAFLHDTMEDTRTSYAEIVEAFNMEIGEAVLALTKFKNIPKEEQIKDSLRRIKLLPVEVWAVKLADRITNLQAPPLEWDYKKRRNYMCDAQLILDELKEANDYLSQRLATKIIDYHQFVYLGEK